VGGIATEISVAQAYISDITTEKERIGAMGKIGAALGAGFIIGPALGGFLSNYGFSGAGYFATALAIVNFVLVFFFLPESRNFKQESSEKVVELGFFKGLINSISVPTIKIVFTLLFISSLAFAAFPVLMPLLARSFFNITEPEMAVFFVYTGFLTIIFQGFIIGKIGKRISETKMILIGSVLMAVGYFIFPFSPNYLFLVLLSAIPGFGSGLLGTALNSYMSKIIPPTELGGTLGIANSIRNLANIPGPFIAGFIFEIFGVSESFFFSATLMGISAFIGIGLFHKRKNMQSKQIQMTKNDEIHP
jgi:DHA1 family tetracycline resistance protein-like MFS transporter